MILLAAGSCTSGRGEQAAAGTDSPLARLRAGQPVERRTQILVLATFHFAEVGERLDARMLDSLVVALEGFRPDAICVETLAGPRVHELELRRDAGPLYAEVLDGFAGRHLELGHAAKEASGRSPAAAFAEARDALARHRAAGTRPDAEERARLALLMLAAYEPSSALVQWAALTEPERASQRAVPAALAARLEAELKRRNEIPALAVRLARRVGLERLHPVDDFEDLDAYPEILDALEHDLKDSALVEAVRSAPVYREAQASLQESLASGDLLPHFQRINAAGFGRDDAEAQWGVYLRTHFPSGSDRARLGLWENRNLKIAARVRAVAALHPGGRVLVIYGAAHKPFLDELLAAMADVQVVQLADLERARVPRH